MVLDFDTFIDQMLRGAGAMGTAFPATLPGPLASRQSASDPAFPMPAPVTPQPVPQQSLSGIHALRQQPPAPSQEQPSEDAGTYVTVTWNYQGTQYTMLMPEDRARTLPEGAQVIGEPIVNDPARIQNARQAGERGVVGQTFSGLIDQAPPEIQAVFRTPAEQSAVTSQRQQQEGTGPVVYSGTGQGYTQDQLDDERRRQGVRQQYPDVTTAQLRASGDPEAAQVADMLEAQGITYVPSGQVAMMQEGGRIVLVDAATLPTPTEAAAQATQDTLKRGTSAIPASPGPGVATRLPTTPEGAPEPLPGLRTVTLRETDPVKAATLENAGIFTVPDGQMAIRTSDGQVRLVPASETAPDGAQVIVYGGQSTAPAGNPGFHPIDYVVGEAQKEIGSLDDGLDWLRANVGAPAMGLFGASAPEVVQTLDGIWDTAQAHLPGPVKWVVDHWTEPAWDAILTSGPGDFGINDIPGLIAPVAIATWASQNPDLVAQVQEHGWDADGDGVADYTGNRAVWEAFAESRPQWQRAILDLQVDPLNWATAGGTALTRTGAGVLGTADRIPFWRWLTGGGLKAVGRALQIPDIVTDGVVLGTVQSLLQPARAVLMRIPVARTLLELSPRALVDRASDEIGQPILDVLGRSRGDLPSQPGGQQAMFGPQMPNPSPGTPPRGLPPNVNPQPTPGYVPTTSTGQVRLAPTPGQPPDPALGILGPSGQPIAQVPVPSSRTPGLLGPTGQPLGQTAQVPELAVVSRQPRLFQGTALAQPAEDIARPDWDFLSPIGREDRDRTPRLIDAVWDARERYPDRWDAFAAEYGPYADAYRRYSEAARARSLTRVKAAETATAEAYHVVHRLLPMIDRHFGDVMPLPAYRPHFDVPGANQSDADVLIERAIFDPDDRRATLAFEDIVQRAKVDPYGHPELNARGEPLGDPALAGEFLTTGRPVYDVVDELRNAYRPYRERYAQQAARQAQRQATEAVQAAPVITSNTRSGETIAQMRARLAGETPAGPVLSDTAITNPATQPEARPALVRADGETPLRAPAAAAPAAPAATGATETELARVPVSKIRSTFGMTDAELADAGVRRYQMREAPFSEATAADVAERYNPIAYRANPISVTPGTDGNYYILSGHSRFEGFRRAGRDEMDVIVHRGDPDALEEFALNSNTDAAGLTMFEKARLVQRRVDQGQTFEQIADAMKAGSATGKRGTGEVRNLYWLNFLPEGSALRKAVAEGTVEVNRGARLGEAIGRGIITPAEADATFRDLSAGDMTLTDVNRAINLHARKVGDGGASQMKLISDQDAGGTGFAETVRELRDLKTEQNRLVADRQAIKRAAARRGGDMPDVDRQNLQQIQERIAEIDAELESLEQSRFVEPMRLPDRQGQMDVGSAGRPVMGTRPVAGETLTAGDVLNTPERTAADQMREAGAADLFSQPPPQTQGPSGQAAFLTPSGQAQVRAQRWADATFRSVENPQAIADDAAQRARMGERFGPDRAVEQDDRFRGRLLGVDEREAFSRTFTDDAGNATETVGERLDRYANDLLAGGMDVESAESEAAKRVINEWAAQALRERPKAYARYQRELQALRDQNARAASQHRLPDAVLEVKALGRAVSREPGPMRVYDDALAILRETALYNTLSGGRYILTQVVGNTITAILTKNWEIVGTALRPSNLRAAYHELQDAPAGLVRSSGDRVLDALDIVKAQPTAVVKDEITQVGADLRLHTAMDRVFRFGREKLPAGKAYEGFRFSSIVANKHVRDVANAVDLSNRQALAEHHLRGNAALAWRDFRRHALEKLPAGIDESEFDRVWSLLPDTEGAGLFGSDDVRSLFAELGHPGYAERMARDWQSAVTKMKKSAQDEVNRVFFTGDEYNVDRIARRIVFFHYWMSRAAPLYTSALMEHAGLLNAYLGMMEEMEASASEYGPAAEGFVKLFSTPLGYNIFIRPDAMIQVFAMFWEDAGYAPDGENWLGKFMRKAGVMFNPIIATIANLSGSMGDTFAPDPLMLGQWTRLVQSAVDFGRANGWLTGNQPAGNVYNDFFSWIRSYTTDLGEDVIPGVEKIPYRDSAVFSHRELNYLIMDVAEERGYERDGIEAMTALNNPNSPLYQEAFRRMADQGMLDQALRYVPLFGTPVLYPKSRVASQDALNRAIAAAPEGSVERDRLTGMRTAANTVDPDASRLRAEADQYFGIGDPETVAAYDTYNAIRHGDATADVTVGGQTATAAQINAAPEDVRRQWADAWAQEQGYTEAFARLRDERGAFLDSGNSYAQYRDWQDTVRRYPGGPVAWWRDTARGNANAARWLKQYQREYTGPVKDYADGLTGMNAYMAVQGMQRTYSDPAPISTNTGQGQPFMAAPPSTGGSAYGERHGPTVESITDQLDRYQRERAEYNAIVSQMYGQQVDIDHLNPMARDATVQIIRDSYGVDVPRLGGDAAGYQRWVAAQPTGADTSIAAYLAWLGSGQPRGAPRLPSLPGMSSPP